MATALRHLVCQFKVTLNGIEPPIWRRIQVPASYSFWDLHVALQDAMGWLDYHLHVFLVRKPRGRKDVEIGIPDEEYEDHVVLPGWRVPIAEYFTAPGSRALYRYDFGDDWEHEVLLEGVLPKEKGARYPRCLAGERACPPEDCGGVPGYLDLLDVLSNPQHEEHGEMVAWLKAHAKNYHPYRPGHFAPAEVRFWDPEKRWRMAFCGDEDIAL